MEEQMVDATSHIAKGKRTKRLRLLSHSGAAAAAAAVVTSSCSSASGGSLSSTTYESIDEEEEDMANCLILLAQGERQSHHHKIKKHQQQQGEYHDAGNISKTEKGNRRFAEISTTATNNTKVGFYIYECKTCNRTFPSFQALGGHRASHKKPKLIIPEEKKPQPQPQPQQPPPPPQQPQLVVTNYDESDQEAGQHRGPTISLQLGSHGHKAIFKANKIHECSVCGSEFTSGQALGGHMRRHRANAATAAVVDNGGVRPRNILQLDLNLPAPEDVDLRESKFQFPVTQKSMVLSAAPALVDCHY